MKLVAKRHHELRGGLAAIDSPHGRG